MHPKGKDNRWSDHYTRRARKEKYPARSVYKLQEIQRKFHLLKKGQRVLDLGCAPGSWLLYAAQVTGPGGLVVGIDLQPVTIGLPGNVMVHTGDVTDPGDDLRAELGKGYHVVLSDMAPPTSGHKDQDAARSLELCRAALALALETLFPGGHLVCKIFHGPDVQPFRDAVRSGFQSVKLFKPQSSRKASKEIFIIAGGKR
jgi:23S rRNA (uridine2552-2'-O)-methyltransferase